MGKTQHRAKRKIKIGRKKKEKFKETKTKQKIKNKKNKEKVLNTKCNEIRNEARKQANKT